MKNKSTIHYALLYRRRNQARLYRSDLIFLVAFLLLGLFSYLSVWFGFYWLGLSGQLGPGFDFGDLLAWQNLLATVRLLSLASLVFWLSSLSYLFYYLRSFFKLEWRLDKTRLFNYWKKTRDSRQLVKEFVISRFASVFLMGFLGSLASLVPGRLVVNHLAGTLNLPANFFNLLPVFLGLLIFLSLLLLLIELRVLSARQQKQPDWT